MRFNRIEEFEVNNGEGAGVSLFVQGCPLKCKNCFNQETWDILGGEEFTDEVKENFYKLIDRPYIKRVSILGGEPLASHNIDDVIQLIVDIYIRFPDKEIWLFTGYKVETLTEHSELFGLVDVIVDGPYIDELKDLSLAFRGSSNQRLLRKEELVRIYYGK